MTEFDGFLIKQQMNGLTSFQLIIMTQSKIMDTFLSQSVSKILTVWRLKKVYFCPDGWKAEIHSFPTMYIIGGRGVRFVEMVHNSDSLKKSA